MKGWIRPGLLALLLVGGSAFAAGGNAPEVKLDPVIERANELNAKQDFVASAAVLKEAVAGAPANPDYHNLYAYALRKGPNPNMDLVFQHYHEALRIDPKHRGAHEYIGEAYLMVGNLAKAKEHLARLDDLCFLPCDEYTDLKKAVAAYEAKKK